MSTDMQSQEMSSGGSGTELSALAGRVMTETTHGSSYFFPSTASGTPLGLAGFAFGLALLSLVQTNWLDTRTLGIVIPVAFGLSALATLVGGLWDFRANNLFGAVWQVLYAGFWLSLGLILNFYSATITTVAGPVKFREAFGTYLIILAIATVALLVASYFVAATAFVTFALVVVLEVVFGFGYLYGNTDLLKLGGYIGLVDALVAFYLMGALIINTTAGRTMLSILPYPYKRSRRVTPPAA